MIESPIVRTCIGAAAGTVAIGPAEERADELEVAVLSAEGVAAEVSGAVLLGLEVAETLVACDREPAAGDTTTTVMRAQTAMAETAIAMPRDQLPDKRLRGAEDDIELLLFPSSVKSRPR